MEGQTPVAAASTSSALEAKDAAREKALLARNFSPVAEAGGKEDETADDVAGDAEAEAEHPDYDMSLCGKIFRTIFVYASYFAVALSLGILGPLLTNLEVVTGSTTSEVSAVFTFRGVLAIVGSLLVGPLLDVVNRYLIVGIALVMDFFFYAAVPWCRSLHLMYIVLAPPEFFNCIIGMGTHLLCIGIWGDDSRSTLQLLNLISVLGFMTAPLLAKPFLMTQAYHIVSNNSGPTLIRFEVNAPESVTSDKLATYSNLVTLESPVTSDEAVTSLYVFVLMAVYSLVVGVVVLAIYLVDCRRTGPAKGPRPETASKETPKRDVIPKAEPTGGNAFVVKISVLYFIFNFFYGGIEIGYAGLVSTFAVKYLGWSTDDGSEVTAVVHGANAVLTAVAVVLSRYIKPQTFVTSNVLAVIASLSLLCLVVELSPVWLWICTAMLGASYASIMPSSISWVSSFMVVDGKFSSAYWAGFFTGFMVIPVITGHLSDVYHAMWFPYCMLLSAVAMGAIYLVLCAVVHIGVKPKNKPADPRSDHTLI